jgi:hypothetical protein
VQYIPICVMMEMGKLTSKGRSPFSGPFLEVRKAIVDAILVEKFRNFW